MPWPHHTNDEYILRTTAVAIGGTITAVVAAAAFVFGAYTNQRDNNALAALDSRSLFVAAALCPQPAEVWQEHRTQRIACVSREGADQVLMAPVERKRIRMVQQ